MAGLQRFITYIYKYENDEKKENTGFAKIEIRGNICRIEVHIRNISVEQQEATVYLFARKEEIIQQVPVGSIAISRGSGDVRYAFDTKELSNFGMAMQKMEGIIIPFDGSVYFASQWKEGDIQQKNFRIMENKTEQRAPEPSAKAETKTEIKQQNQPAAHNRQPAQNQAPARNQPAPQNQPPAGNQPAPQNQPPAGNQPALQNQPTAANQSAAQKQTAETGEPEAQNETVRTEKSDEAEKQIQATELPLEEFFEENGWEGIFKKLRLKLDIFYPFEGEDIECVRMQLTDLQELPRKYWYIGNNSFLLHGFFNYKHIIFGKIEENDKKEYFLGVPGVFQNQERVMASMFGFPEFRTAKAAEYKTGNFGYWYRII